MIRIYDQQILICNVEKFLLPNFFWSHTPLFGPTLFRVYEIKYDKKVDNGTMKSWIVKISPL